MNLSLALLFSCLVLAVSAMTQSVSAATPEKQSGDVALAQAGDATEKATTFGRPPNVPPQDPPPVDPPGKDKPKRSKVNPNDGKDNDPDDGDAGKGNDDKEKPKDGPAND